MERASQAAGQVNRTSSSLMTYFSFKTQEEMSVFRFLQQRLLFYLAFIALSRPIIIFITIYLIVHIHGKHDHWSHGKYLNWKLPNFMKDPEAVFSYLRKAAWRLRVHFFLPSQASSSDKHRKRVLWRWLFLAACIPKFRHCCNWGEAPVYRFLFIQGFLSSTY